MTKAKKFAKTEMKEALAELEQRIDQCHEKVCGGCAEERRRRPFSRAFRLPLRATNIAPTTIFLQGAEDNAVASAAAKATKKMKRTGRVSVDRQRRPESYPILSAAVPHAYTHAIPSLGC